MYLSEKVMISYISTVLVSFRQLYSHKHTQTHTHTHTHTHKQTNKPPCDYPECSPDCRPVCALCVGWPAVQHQQRAVAGQLTSASSACWPVHCCFSPLLHSVGHTNNTMGIKDVNWLRDIHIHPNPPQLLFYTGWPKQTGATSLGQQSLPVNSLR